MVVEVVLELMEMAAMVVLMEVAEEHGMVYLVHLLVMVEPEAITQLLLEME